MPVPDEPDVRPDLLQIAVDEAFGFGVPEDIENNNNTAGKV